MEHDRYELLVKRIYEAPAPEDGFRVLVDRLWPRGVSKEDAALGLWLPAIAPSVRLRKWFGHDGDRWEAFKESYYQELDERPDVITELFQKAAGKTITLLYAAQDERYNNAVALRDYLEGM